MLIAGARGSPASNTPQASLAATLQVFVTFADTDFVTSLSRQAGLLFLTGLFYPRRKSPFQILIYGGQELQGALDKRRSLLGELDKIWNLQQMFNKI